ncbi:MAG: interleukin-like EMT inducer domain-containing protein [Caldilineaceae bacterium]
MPGQVLVNTINVIDLQWNRTAVPRAVLGGNRQIGTTGVELPIDVDITAFADGGWIALYDEMGTQVDGSTGRRGINVTVLNDDGTILAKAGFDTEANEFESEKLAAFLGQVASGRPIVVASYGDATAHLTTEAVTALRNLGADVTQATLQDQQFAIIGVQGAAPGSAQVVTDTNSAFLRISLERDRRPLAAAVDQIAITRRPN